MREWDEVKMRKTKGEDRGRNALVFFGFLLYIANLLRNLLQSVLVDAVLRLQVLEKSRLAWRGYSSKE